MSKIIFNYIGVDYEVQCNKNEKFKDIIIKFRNKAKAETKILIFNYKGAILQNEELTFEEIEREDDKGGNQINILVYEIELDPDPEAKCIIKPKNIICPECQEQAKFKLENYTIILNDCKNKHLNNLFIEEFEPTQIIDISKIICDDCKNYNKSNIYDNTFYRCNFCKINLCPICFSKHDKSHNVVNYDDKDYICEEHNKNYIEYCENCKKNICIFCEKDHTNHSIINFGKLIPNKNNLNTLLADFEEKKNKLNDDIKELIMRLNKVKENIESYYNICKSMINNYNQEKLNYEILYNINNLTKDNVINDINYIINNNKINDKFNKLNEIYEKMNSINIITIIYKIKKEDENLKYSVMNL